MKEEINVEGYKILIEPADGEFTVSVPELPGCARQVSKRGDVEGIMRKVIGEYLAELARQKIKERKIPRKTSILKLKI